MSRQHIWYTKSGVFRSFTSCLLVSIGGTYGTIYHQAVVTGAALTGFAVCSSVCITPFIAGWSGCRAVQSPAECSRTSCLAGKIWFGSTVVRSILEMGGKCFSRQFWLLVCQ